MFAHCPSSHQVALQKYFIATYFLDPNLDLGSVQVNKNLKIFVKMIFSSTNYFDITSFCYYVVLGSQRFILFHSQFQYVFMFFLLLFLPVCAFEVIGESLNRFKLNIQATVVVFLAATGLQTLPDQTKAHDLEINLENPFYFLVWSIDPGLTCQLLALKEINTTKRFITAIVSYSIIHTSTIFYFAAYLNHLLRSVVEHGEISPPTLSVQQDDRLDPCSTPKNPA